MLPKFTKNIIRKQHRIKLCMSQQTSWHGFGSMHLSQTQPAITQGGKHASTSFSITACSSDQLDSHYCRDKPHNVRSCYLFPLDLQTTLYLIQAHLYFPIKFRTICLPNLVRSRSAHVHTLLRLPMINRVRDSLESSHSHEGALNPSSSIPPYSTS